MALKFLFIVIVPIQTDGYNRTENFPSAIFVGNSRLLAARDERRVVHGSFLVAKVAKLHPVDRGKRLFSTIVN